MAHPRVGSPRPTATSTPPAGRESLAPVSKLRRRESCSGCCFSLSCLYHICVFLVLFLLGPSLSAPFTGNMLWSLISTQACADTADNEMAVSGLKVLLAGTSHTGTNSMVVALQQMGLRAYHHEDLGMFASWILRHDNILESWARPLSRCKVDAVALEPWLDNFNIALQSSPGVKVIVTTRTYETYLEAVNRYKPPARHTTVHMANLQFSSSVRTIPWLLLWDMVFGTFSELLRKGDPIYNADITFPAMLWNFAVAEPITFTQEYSTAFLPQMEENFYYSEEAYLAYHHEVYSQTRKEDLLIFDFRKHGWAELEKFLGIPRPANATKLPRVNAKTGTQHAIIDSRPDLYAACIALFLFFHLVNYLLLCMLLRVLFWPCCGIAPRRPK
eukprot:gnl/TRDRNA2_/TRDRNA2_144082_c0_seq2.p1 gnl/TRDRNA2_/TRDRNA2_144082_c0~~gnl/TRDRNA2_/TRDRNA2_144082_c0_seq2.p1  ORF type:complete len:387 (+),score=50.80 gnl/TRDRNA2_/TRDRNA2_144082_c0_seq2:33-1193(+)